MTPSIKTCGRLLTVTTITTRSSTPGPPIASRNRVCSGERLLKVNDSWKALRSVALVVTSTEARASIRGFGAGSGTTGPASSVRYMPLATTASGYAGGYPRRQCYTQHLARFRSQCVRVRCRIGVAQNPIQQRIAELGVRHIIDAVPLDRHILAQGRVLLGLRNDAPLQIAYHRP